MRLRRKSTIALLAAAFALLALTLTPAPAVASGASNPVIADCLAHPGGLTGHYTVAELKHALQVMPAETKEYTSCPDVINRALLAALTTTSGTGTTGGTSGGSGSFLPTPVIIVLVVLVLAAVTFGAIAIRRRQAGERAGSGEPDPDA